MNNDGWMDELMYAWCVQMDSSEWMMDKIMGVWCVHVYELDG